MAELTDEGADGHGLLAIYVGGPNFGLGSQTHEIGHAAGDGVNGDFE